MGEHSTVYKNGGANRGYLPLGNNSPQGIKVDSWGPTLPLGAKLYLKIFLMQLARIQSMFPTMRCSSKKCECQHFAFLQYKKLNPRGFFSESSHFLRLKISLSQPNLSGIRVVHVGT
jgi:hypothetical protein